MTFAGAPPSAHSRERGNSGSCPRALDPRLRGDERINSCDAEPRVTTIALPTPAAPPRSFPLDLSRPILIVCALLLCVLIILPLSWLVYYSLIDRSGAFTLANFHQLFADPVFLDPLITTLIIAVSSSIACCAIAAPMGWLVARTDLPLTRHGAGAGDRILRHPAVPRRHRLGTAGGAQQRAPQQAVPRHHRRAAGRVPVQHLFADRADLRDLLLHFSLCVRAGRQCARPHTGRSRRRLLHPRRQAPG